jgi:hypothetical protein
MNLEIETEAAQFPEKEYINGILIAVQLSYGHSTYKVLFISYKSNVKIGRFHSKFEFDKW